MARTIALLLGVLLAGVIAWAASRTPAPAPDRPGQFSGQRAFADVQAIAARPHPIGSADHDRVRDYIISRFTGLGLQVRIQYGHAFEREIGGGEAYFEGGEVQNIVAVLPGKSGATPAVAVMAHYDTVPSSPGAADDTVGVASALEIARILKAAGPPEHDIVFLITDGEEAGLLGARSFFAGDPLASRIGAVLNMESRGGGGRAYMFETGPNDGAMIDLFTANAANPTASSLAGYVYAHMSNDTDFTVSRKRGIAGFNYAFIGRPFDYHAASSTAAVLDRGSLQHIGQQVLSATRALSQAKALPAPRADVVYSDLLGGPMIVYPTWAGWLVLAAAGALAWVSLRKALAVERWSLVDTLRGAGAMLLTAALAALLLHLARLGTGVGGSFRAEKALLSRFDIFEAALALICLGVSIVVPAVVGLGKPRFWSAFAGALGLGFVLAIGLQAAAPLVAFMLAWPLLVATLIAAALAFRWVGGWERPSAAFFVALVGGLALAQLAYVAHPVALGVGAELPEALAAFLLMAALPFFPLLWPAQGDGRRPWIGVGALVLALGPIGFVRVAQPWDARHPRPTHVVFAADIDHHRFLRATGIPKPDAWTLSALPGDGGPVKQRPLEPILGQNLSAGAWPVTVERPVYAILPLTGGRTTIRLAPVGARARQLAVDVKTSGSFVDARINGLPASFADKPGQWTHIVWDAPSDGLVVSFATKPATHLQTRYGVVIDGWPRDAPALPRRPANAMPWQNSDTTVLIGSLPAPG